MQTASKHFTLTFILEQVTYDTKPDLKLARLSSHTRSESKYLTISLDIIF